MPSSGGPFPPQGSNPSLLHLQRWQAGPLPPAPPGKPSKYFYGDPTTIQNRRFANSRFRGHDFPSVTRAQAGSVITREVPRVLQVVLLGRRPQGGRVAPGTGRPRGGAVSSAHGLRGLQVQDALKPEPGEEGSGEHELGSASDVKTTSQTQRPSLHSWEPTLACTASHRSAFSCFSGHSW